MTNKDCQTIRELGYKGCIPYFILFDKDLTGQHFRFYSVIEQMHSNPNPKVIPRFSYEWLASLLGVEIRSAKRIAKLMKDKGYVSHTQTDNGYWVWSICGKPVIDNSYSELPPEVSPDVTGVVTSGGTPGVTCKVTLNTNNINYSLKETKLEPSSGFLFSKTTDQNLLEQKIKSDKRTDEEFLAECLYHVENHSDKKYPLLQRANALVKLLRKLKEDNVIFRYGTKTQLKEKEINTKYVPTFTEDEVLLMQEYLHAKKMANWGQDINIYMPREDLREKAQNLINKAKTKEDQLCKPSQNNNARKNFLTSALSSAFALN